RFGRRCNNFGDLLGPLIVRKLIGQHLAVRGPRRLTRTRRVLTVGSILHAARDRDTIWGTGVNGKNPVGELRFSSLDVRAVRGPRTADILRGKGIDTPAVYGDPALLLPALFPELWNEANTKTRRTVYLPNLHDEKRWAG